jgi:hypothetical protein
MYGYDLLDEFSSVEELCWDDAFAETVLGSQGNKEDQGTRKSWSVCFGDAFLVKGKNG